MERKNRKKMVIQLILLLVVLGAIAWLVNSYFNSAGYFLSKLPNEYKETPALDTTIQSNHHQIKTLFSGGKVKDIHLDSLHQITVIQRMDEIRPENGNTILKVTYYRLDKTGKLIDTLVETSENDQFVEEFGGYLMYPNYYTTYLLSGGLEKRSYVESNRDLSMDQESLRALLTRNAKTADAIYSNYMMEDGKTRDLFVFVINEQLHRVFVKNRDAFDLPSKYSNKAYVQMNPITAYDYSTDRSYDWKNKKQPLQLDYFLKQEYHSASSPGFMSPAPISRPENWEGVGYFSIPFAHDTLKFKHPIYYYPNKDWPRVGPYYENNKWGKMDFFNIPGAEFQILTVGFDTGNIHDLDGCYLIIGR